MLASVAQASLLAKALTLEARGFSIFVDLDCFVMPDLLADAFMRLKERGVGVIAFSQFPSRGFESVKHLGNRIVHRLGDEAEMKAAQNLMGLKEVEENVQSERRHRLYQREVLRFLRRGEAVVQRSDVPNPVMVIFEKSEGMSGASFEPVHGERGRTPLEVDFGGRKDEALKILELVHDFPNITLGQVVGGLPELGEAARELTLRLIDRGYLTSLRDRRGRKVLAITRRGEEALRGIEDGR